MRLKQAGQGRLVALVVTHDRLAKLQETVARLLQSPAAQLAVLVVVDNASTDGTGDWLAGLSDPRVDVLTLPNNQGGAGGFEHGMRRAVARHDPDWVVVMDDDARPDPGALTLFHSKDRTKAEAWAAAVYLPGGQICDMNRPSINPFWHAQVFWRTVLGQGRDGFHLTEADYTAADILPVDGASFVGLFVSRAAIAKAGYPDGRLFLYGDDVLYTLGLTRGGARILFDPDLRFEHDFSTMSGEDRRFRPLWKTYYHYRNLLIVYRLSAGWMSVFVLPAAVAKWALKARHHKGERRTFLRLLGWAVRDGLTGRLEMDHDRLVAETRKPRPQSPKAP